MQVIRSEIRTGLLVLITIGALVALVLYIGAPGVFKKLNTYYVQIDNAAGIKPGAPVNLAGRKVGQIIELKSPVPMKDRPAGKPNYEVLITVRVEADAPIYNSCHTRMVAYGLLSELVVDFIRGDETSGRAENGHVFVGEREAALSELAPQVLDKLEPLIISGRETLSELKTTVINIGKITSTDSEFNLALGKFHQLGDNLAQITDPKGSLTQSLDDSVLSLKNAMSNIERITNDFKTDDLKVTLSNFRSASNDLKGAVSSLDTTINNLSPDLIATGRNASQLTDTLKRQPWRILWPSTKKYSGDGSGDVEVRHALPVRRR